MSWSALLILVCLKVGTLKVEITGLIFNCKPD